VRLAHFDILDLFPIAEPLKSENQVLPFDSLLGQVCVLKSLENVNVAAHAIDCL
jgi:hypothetical protein